MSYIGVSQTRTDDRSDSSPALPVMVSPETLALGAGACGARIQNRSVSIHVIRFTQDNQSKLTVRRSLSELTEILAQDRLSAPS